MQARLLRPAKIRSFHHSLKIKYGITTSAINKGTIRAIIRTPYPCKYSLTISRSILQDLPSLVALIFPLSSNCFAVLSVIFRTTHNCVRLSTRGTSFQLRYLFIVICPFVFSIIKAYILLLLFSCRKSENLLNIR